MSTYLLAFVVSDFEMNTNEGALRTGEKVHQIYTRPDAVGSTRIALESSAAFLKELEDYVTSTYELTRTIHVAIPDFTYGKNEKIFRYLTQIMR